MKLLSSLEDTIEVTEENTVPLVGICFEELIEVGHSNAHIVTRRRRQVDANASLLGGRPELSTLSKAYTEYSFL